MKRKLGIRWTIGDVSAQGFDALRLSIHGARRLFGPTAEYAVCVNSIPAEVARARVGDVPVPIHWHENTAAVPEFIRKHLDPRMADGVGWKFAPLRFFPADYHELALDNDCILWDLPRDLKAWLERDDAVILAADVVPAFGKFAHLCGPEPRNSGIRGLPPGFDYEYHLKETLAVHPVVMDWELDEQGLQTAALQRGGETLVVTTDEVTICSPFPPHLPHLGSHGAHFCGLNAHSLPWALEGRPTVEYVREHWQNRRQAILAKLDLPSDDNLSAHSSRCA